MTAYRLLLLIALWIFILLWISPLASFASSTTALPPTFDASMTDADARAAGH